jgi:hypothetical protein
LSLLSLLLKLFLISTGAIVGVLLPDIEALITAFYVEPQHHVSRMIQSFYKNRKFKLLQRYWGDNRREYKSLIVYSSFFQLVFFVFSFYVVTSSGSSFASGLCLAFLGRLFYEQYMDFKTGHLKEWFWAINLPLTKRFYQVYFGVLGVLYFYMATLIF